MLNDAGGTNKQPERSASYIHHPLRASSQTDVIGLIGLPAAWFDDPMHGRSRHIAVSTLFVVIGASLFIASFFFKKMLLNPVLESNLGSAGIAIVYAGFNYTFSYTHQKSKSAEKSVIFLSYSLDPNALVVLVIRG